MKLRTEMVDPGFGMSWEALLPDHYDAPLHIWAPAAQHDAMAAHALLQAMREFHPSNEAARASFELAKKRAADILVGWLGEDRG